MVEAMDRKDEILAACLEYLAESIGDEDEFHRVLIGSIGITEEEAEQYGFPMSTNKEV